MEFIGAYIYVRDDYYTTETLLVWETICFSWSPVVLSLLLLVFAYQSISSLSKTRALLVNNCLIWEKYNAIVIVLWIIIRSLLTYLYFQTRLIHSTFWNRVYLQSLDSFSKVERCSEKTWQRKDKIFKNTRQASFFFGGEIQIRSLSSFFLKILLCWKSSYKSG